MPCPDPKVLILLLTITSPTGCATAGQLRSEPLDAGVSRVFAADLSHTLEAAQEAVVEAGLQFDAARNPSADTYLIEASAGASAWSWGELVRVVVMAQDATNTRVSVLTRRRVSTNVTAKGDYSDAILGWIDLRLRAVPQRSQSDPIRATDPVDWPRPLVPEHVIVELRTADLNLAAGSTPFEVISPAVVALAGTRAGGTAFIISKDGLGLTNDHVVEGQTGLIARLHDGRELPVRVLRSDAKADVALIQIPCEPVCYTAPLGSDEELKPTDEILVLGMPLSEVLAHSVTKGIVSGKRFFQGITMLQVDAAINPGNSGGPIIDPVSGAVVGIATAKMVAEDVEGIGFGIAISDALRVLGIRALAR